MEVEALQSIYLTDLTVLASVPSLTPTSPPLPCHLSLTILPEPLLDRERANHSILSLSIQYPTLSLPLHPPSITATPVKGLDSTLISEVTSLIHQQLDRLWEEDVGHDGVMVSLCAAVHEWLRVHNVESVSVHEEMKRREARAAEEAERQRALQQMQAEREERERKEKLAAEIQLINRKKERQLEAGRRQRPAQPALSKPALSSPVLSPLPAAPAGKSASSEDSKWGEGKRLAEVPSPVLGVRAVKAMRAKERQLEKRQQKQQRQTQRRDKRAVRLDGDDDDEASTSNPIQVREDSEADSSSSDTDGASEEEKEESDEEAAVSLFSSPFLSGSGGLSFFDQKKKNELHILAELDKRDSHPHPDSDHSGSDSSDTDTDTDAEALSPPPAPKRTTSIQSPKKASKATSTPSKAAVPTSPSDVLPSSSYSRYRSDFEELQLLGRGGFGEVFKVRNRVDKLLYAVKRIRLKRRGNGSVNKRILREVSTIGMLHHTFIVRYYQAWIVSSQRYPRATYPTNHPVRSLLTPAVLCVTGWCVLQEEEDEEEGKDSAKRREAWRLEEAAEGESDWLSSSNFHGSFDAESDDDEDAEDEDDDVGSNRSSRRSSEHSGCGGGGQLLYIQMEYAANKTLKDVIADRLCERNVEACWRLFRQTLEAVAYIHSKDIVHRDLKPANIFIDHQQSIKLGDFGHQLTPLTAHHTLASPLAWLTYRCWAAVLWCRAGGVDGREGSSAELGTRWCDRWRWRRRGGRIECGEQQPARGGWYGVLPEPGAGG